MTDRFYNEVWNLCCCSLCCLCFCLHLCSGSWFYKWAVLNKIFSYKLPHQVVEWQVKQYFENHLFPHHQRTDCLWNLSASYIPVRHSWWESENILLNLVGVKTLNYISHTSVGWIMLVSINLPVRYEVLWMSLNLYCC